MDLNEVFENAIKREKERSFEAEKSAVLDMLKFINKNSTCVICYFSPCRCHLAPYDCGTGV